MKKKSTNKRSFLVVILILAMLAFVLGPMLKNSKSKPAPRSISVTKKNKQNQNKDPEYFFTKEGELTFHSNQTNKNIKINIEIADNFKDRMVGLMFRKQMDDGQGMLFIFDEEGPQAFWMKNTLVALDIIYVNSLNEIVDIYPNTTPKSMTSLPSKANAQYVIETIAGFTDYHKIIIGDKVNWRID